MSESLLKNKKNQIIASGLGAILAAGGAIGYKVVESGSSQKPVNNVVTTPESPTATPTLTPAETVMPTPTSTESVRLVPNGNSNGGHVARSPQPTSTEVRLVPNSYPDSGHAVRSPLPSESASLVPNGNDGGHVSRTPATTAPAVHVARKPH